MRRSRSSRKRRKLEKAHKNRMDKKIAIEGEVIKIKKTAITYDYASFKVFSFKPEKGKQKVKVKIRVGERTMQVDAIASKHEYEIRILNNKRIAA
jgi:hypothetical protein